MRSRVPGQKSWPSAFLAPLLCSASTVFSVSPTEKLEDWDLGAQVLMDWLWMQSPLPKGMLTKEVCALGVASIS